MKTDDLDFDLPPELIAQAPSPQRGASRLLHYRRADRSISHRFFSDLPRLLRPGDLMVFNDARVLPARFLLKKRSGGLVEGLFLEEPRPQVWRVLLKNAGKASEAPLRFVEAPDVEVQLLEKRDGGEWMIAVKTDGPAPELLGKVGRMPLPPYIRRNRQRDDRDDLDRTRYQTVFARTPGAVAAPTAALHISAALLDHLRSIGIETAFVTLQVGLGTFKPVTAEALAQHAMHVERYCIESPAAAALNRAKADGRRIVAVGTTAARVLESQEAASPFQAVAGETGIFIYPPYAWKHVGALVTNFHLPRSTLIALVAAFIGLDEQRRVYREAIDQRYRFFSYGDGMLIE